MGKTLIISGPGVITNPRGKIVPGTVANPLHRAVMARAVATAGAITSVPAEAGNSVTIAGAPTKVAGPAFTYASFDGVDDSITLAGGLVISSFTAMVVARIPALTGTYRSALQMTPPNGVTWDLTWWSASNTFRGIVPNGSGNTTIISTAVPDTGWHVYTITADGTTSTVGVDTVETSVAVTNSATIGFTLGRGRGGFNPLDVAEYAIFPALSASQRAAEIANYRALYGI